MRLVTFPLLVSTRYYSNVKPNLAQEISELLGEKSEVADEIVKRKREHVNVSQLSPQLLERVEETIPSYRFPHDKSLRRMRRNWARLGHEKTSDEYVDVRCLWPTREELERWPKQLNLEESMRILKERKIKEKKRIEEIRMKIDKRRGEMEKLMEKFREKEIKRLRAEEKKSEKDAKLLSMARDFYGYHIDLHDARMRTMIAELETKEKLEQKQKKKEEKAKRAAELMERTIQRLKEKQTINTLSNE
ncbi:hypothetical protein SNEBB_000218 [Seison nebaliae]|nr:hypothetical protein SNEBB_000218 [Seison nebaliae]